MSRHVGSHGRGVQVKRILELILLMEHRAWTIGQMAEHFSVSDKTVRRDLAVLEDCDVPLFTFRATGDSVRMEVFWKVDRAWLSRRVRSLKQVTPFVAGRMISMVR